MHSVVALLIGGLVGWLASIVMGVSGRIGILVSVVVGMIGAFLGRWLVGIAGMSVQGQVAWWVVAVAGAALTISVVRYFGIFGGLTSAR